MLLVQLSKYELAQNSLEKKKKKRISSKLTQSDKPPQASVNMHGLNHHRFTFVPFVPHCSSSISPIPFLQQSRISLMITSSTSRSLRTKIYPCQGQKNTNICVL